MVEEQIASIGKEFANYNLEAHGLRVSVKIVDMGDFIPAYEVTVPGIGDATKVLLESLRQEMLAIVPIDPNRIEDKEYIDELTKRYTEASEIVLDKYLPGTIAEKKNILIAYLINLMLGLGELEPPLADEDLEEVVVNTARGPVWVFHKRFGWCKTNIKLKDETATYNLSEQIGRRVGRQITNLTPIMDAELPDGSRVNSTLYPISQSGNTITIRKFSKNPWTMPALIAIKTISSPLAALIWICVQNEISLLISGGTASGKTSFLNAMSIFMPANHRIISVEQTRELTLPQFLQWVPMLTRQANPEGKGAVTLYDLMINALRQRPDIMIVGEIRVKQDAETLFEAIHTGHAVYGTVHADNAQDTIIRMTNPPIEIPKIMLNAMGGLISLFRHRRLGIRRVLEVAEILLSGDSNVLNRWDLRSDVFYEVNNISRLAETIALYGGYSLTELKDEISQRAKILDWMVKNNVVGIDACGLVVANFYKNPQRVAEIINENMPYSADLFKRL